MDVQTELENRIQAGELSNDYCRFMPQSIYLDQAAADESKSERDSRIRTAIGIESLKQYYTQLPSSRRTPICGGCGRIQTNPSKDLEQIPLENLGCYRVRILSDSDIPERYEHHLYVKYRKDQVIGPNNLERLFFGDFCPDNNDEIKLAVGAFVREAYYKVVTNGCSNFLISDVGIKHDRIAIAFPAKDCSIDDLLYYVDVHICQRCNTNIKTWRTLPNRYGLHPKNCIGMFD